MIKYVAIALISVLLSCVSQVLLKKAGNRQWPSRVREYLNAYVIGGYCLLGVCMLLGVYVMTGLDLKYSAVIESLGYVITVAVSQRLFHERVTKTKWLGIASIIAGIVVFNLGF